MLYFNENYRHIGENAKIQVIKNAGHALNIEKPREFAKHLKAFLFDDGPNSSSSSSLSLGWSWSWSSSSSTESSSDSSSNSNSNSPPNHNPYSLSYLRHKSFFWTSPSTS